MKYLPDYYKGELLEKEFFFGFLSALYSKEVTDIVGAPSKARKTNYNKDNDMIALLHIWTQRSIQFLHIKVCLLNINKMSQQMKEL